jgi:adenylosuccinate synthase
MIKAIVGANWGDEGKGKVTDVFAQSSDIVIRYQGGNNAGHTIINEYGKFALHMLPSGIFNPHTLNIIGPGVALNIHALMKEIKMVKERYPHPIKLLVSDRAQVVMSYHPLFDQLEEARMGHASFGSTKSGIAPFYSDKYAKLGFQVQELFHTPSCIQKLERVLPIKNALLKELYHHEALKIEDLLEEIESLKSAIAPYVADTFLILKDAMVEKKVILLEGQLGALRDPDYGIYPYSTSSSTLASYAPLGSGLMSHLDEVWAVTKAYSSAVGAGPFVAELFGEEAQALRSRGGDAGEYGATTGRPRCVGWFDAVATRYGCAIQNATHVVLTNIDVLSYLDEIPIITHYELEDGSITPHFLATSVLWSAKPVIKKVPGWKVDITQIQHYHDLPQEAKHYVDTLEELIGVKIAMVSNGPRRDQILKRL